MPDTDRPGTAPEQLGRSYGALLEQHDWQVDEMAPPVSGEGEPATATPPPPLRIIEALLFVGGEPLTAERAAEIIRGLTPEQFDETVAALNHTYRRQGRPYTIQPQGKGHVLTLRSRYRSVLEKLFGTNREARLSNVAVDVLALVAYRQPVAKHEVDSLRGAESGALLRQLVRRGLVAVVRRADADRKEVLYGTTSRFLELFGLRSLDDLPRTQDLQQI